MCWVVSSSQSSVDMTRITTASLVWSRRAKAWAIGRESTGKTNESNVVPCMRTEGFTSRSCKAIASKNEASRQSSHVFQSMPG
jgi:hypothetical protein